MTAPDEVAEAVLAHPCVTRLHGGPFGTVASYLPGRTVLGVRMGEIGEPVEVAVVVRLLKPLPDTIAEIRGRIRGIVGQVPVHVLVSDVDSAES